MQCLIHQLLLLELPTFQKQVLSRPPPHLQSPSSLKVNAIYFHITADVYFLFEYAHCMLSTPNTPMNSAPLQPAFFLSYTLIPSQRQPLMLQPTNKSLV